MKKIISILLIVILAGGAAALLAKRKAGRAKARPAAVLPVVADSLRLKSGPVTLTLPAMGVVSSELSTTLSTKISGRLVHIYKQEGDHLEKGDRLADIDAGELAAKKQGLRLKMEGIDYQIQGMGEKIKAMENSLTAARETHARTVELLRVQGASEEQSRREEANLATLEAGIAAEKSAVSGLIKSKETLRQNIREIENQESYATITAPICGTLSRRLVQPGDLATPGKALFRIAACSGRYLDLSLPDSVRPEKIIFQGKELLLAAKNEASATGLTQYIAALPDDSRVVEGQFVNIRLVIYEGQGVLVPVDGLLTTAGTSSVLTLEKTKALKQRAEILARGSEGAVVQPDLAGRLILIAKPDILLRAAAGVPVLVNDPQKEQTEQGTTPAPEADHG